MPMNNRLLVPQKLPLLLDYAPGAAAAYSLRWLSNSYTGPVVRGRRGVDAAQRDFAPSEITDGTVQAWNDEVGSTGVIVTTWYDQSGNGNDAVQATSAYMPVLYSAATGLVTEGGKPAIRFDGGDDWLDLSSGVTVSRYTNFAVAATDGITSNPVIGTDGGQSLGLWDSGYWFENQGGGYSQTPYTQDAGQHVFSATKSGDSYDDFACYADGAYIGLPVAGAGFASATWKYIGARKVSGVAYFTGTISELILYPADMTALRTRIEADMAWYY